MKTRPDTPMLDFLMLTEGQLDGLMSLRVAKHEEHLIAPVAEWLAEAAFTPDAISFGIYASRKPVGLLSLIDPRLIDEDDDISHFQPDCLYVWRIMTDYRCRQSGYGTAALQFIFDYARCIGLEGVSLTTMDQEKGNALPFYEGLGFQPTGRRIDNEIELVCRELRTR